MIVIIKKIEKIPDKKITRSFSAVRFLFGGFNSLLSRAIWYFWLLLFTYKYVLLTILLNNMNAMINVDLTNFSSRQQVDVVPTSYKIVFWLINEQILVEYNFFNNLLQQNKLIINLKERM